MGARLRTCSWILVSLCCLCSLPAVSLAQQVSSQPRITQQIVETNLVTLKGNTYPLARLQFDTGAASPDMPMQRMLLVLKRSPEQEYTLRTLLDTQQDKLSPQYHKWLTPDEFGAQFGPNDQDVQTVVGWLQLHGFQVNNVSHGRTVIEFSGTEGQVEEALHTAIHKYAINGQEHWANASDPQIPAALAPVVAGIASLNNFPAHAFSRIAGPMTREKATGVVTPAKPLVTIPSNGCGVQTNDCYAVGPYDFATIYDVLPAWSASTPIDGTGQTIAIVGETDIDTQDITDFRNFFGLPAYGQSGGPSLNVIHDGPAPGLLNGEETEADLDVEWSGAVAKGASIDFVVSETTETTLGVNLSALYIVDNNLAPVMSESYGQCELFIGTGGNQFFSALWQQAAAQGITVMVSSGDGGSAGCDNFDAPGPAEFGLAVSGFASTPYNVAVGGTDFNDLTNASTYWNLTNAATTLASAKSYVPETTWDDTCTNPVFGALLGFSKDAETNCNNSQLVNAGFVNIVGGSGGKSSCTTSDGQRPGSCAIGYTKPSWQVGSGVPGDNVRDVPDVSLFAASGSPSGSFYIVCEADAVNPGFTSCNANDPSTQFLGVGGTSASSPAFAGVMALVNQKTNSTQGNANFVLYKLAQQHPTAFHDIASGTIEVPCQTASPNCTTTHAGDRYGILNGYNAAAGYDLATGLGSIDVNNLLQNWISVIFRPTTTSLVLAPASNLTHGEQVTVTGSVAPSSGTGVPSGAVALMTSTGLSIDGFKLSNGAISGNTALLPGGSYTVKAHYGGDATFGGSDSPDISVAIGKENSSPQIRLVTFDWNGNQTSSNASSAVYGSPYILRVNLLNGSGAVCNPAPLGESACPTGDLTISDNGNPLDGGTFALNSLGYAEDQAVQLGGGSQNLSASYAGDSSFNPSSVSTTYSITPAVTTVGGTFWNASYATGQLQANLYIQAQSTGVVPTGTFSFYVNGASVPGSVTYNPYPSSPSNPNVMLQATFYSNASPFPIPGTYTLSATYSGDGNYQSLTFPPSTVSLKFPPSTVFVQSSSYSVNAGASVTLSATIIGYSTTLAPTGTISFTSSLGTIPGTATYSTITDSNTGNLDMVATISMTPTFTDSYGAQYSGDANFGAGLSTSAQVVVSGSDFSFLIQQSTVTLSAGGYAQIPMLIGMQSGAAPVTFSATPCTGLPAESTCSPSSTSVPYTSSNPLNIGTTGPHTVANKRQSAPGLFVAAFLLMPFVGAVWWSVPRGRLCRAFGLGILSVVLLLGLGCGGSGNNLGGGGGNGGGGRTDPGTPIGTYNITVTGTSGSGSSAISHTATFTLVVQ